MSTPDPKSPINAVVSSLKDDIKPTPAPAPRGFNGPRAGGNNRFPSRSRGFNGPRAFNGPVAGGTGANRRPSAFTPRPPRANTDQEIDQAINRAVPRSMGTDVQPGAGAPERTGDRGPAPRRRSGRPISRMKRPEHRRVRVSSTPRPVTKKEDEIQPVGDNIRIIPLGGVEEIGKNMTVVEIGNDIIVIDAGFQFKEADTPGVDYILPNTRYLEERKDRVRALIVTHGHLDHIGAIPFIMEKMGNPPVYTRNLTALFIKKRQTEFPQVEPINFKIVEKNDKVQIGNLIVRFFGVTHTIPDSMGIIIETKLGNIVTPGDYKLEHTDGIPSDREEKEYDALGKENNLLLFTDSTNVANPGFSTPEKVVHQNLAEIIKSVKGRLIISLFASQLERITKIIEFCEDLGKKVLIEGRTMKTNVEIAIQAEILKVKKGTFIDAKDIDAYPPDRVVVIATGAQGDEFGALSRMSTKNYKYLQLSKKDIILLSSSVVPGNEKAVQKLKDNLARQGVKIIEYRTSDLYIHSTGHGNREEILWLHRKIKPKFFIPIHGSHYMLRLHAQLAIEQIGMPEENIIIPDDGSIIEIQENGTKMVLLDKKAPSQQVTVDGFTVGDMQEVVMRDRQILGQDGIFVIFALLDQKTGRVRQSPDIISRGSVYLQESQDILREVRFIIKRAIEKSIQGMNPINFDYVKNLVNDEVGRFLFQETAKKPIVITVIRTV